MKSTFPTETHMCEWSLIDHTDMIIQLQPCWLALKSAWIQSVRHFKQPAEDPVAKYQLHVYMLEGNWQSWTKPSQHCMDVFTKTEGQRLQWLEQKKDTVAVMIVKLSLVN